MENLKDNERIDEKGYVVTDLTKEPFPLFLNSIKVRESEVKRFQVEIIGDEIVLFDFLNINKEDKRKIISELDRYIPD